MQSLMCPASLCSNYINTHVWSTAIGRRPPAIQHVTLAVGLDNARLGLGVSSPDADIWPHVFLLCV